VELELNDGARGGLDIVREEFQAGVCVRDGDDLDDELAGGGHGGGQLRSRDCRCRDRAGGARCSPSRPSIAIAAIASRAPRAPRASRASVAVASSTTAPAATAAAAIAIVR
jgi:hypothetical protein